MEVLANLWIVWLLGMLVTVVWAIFVSFGIFKSIVVDDREKFDSGIDRKNVHQWITLGLIALFGVLLVFSVIANIIVAITD